MWNFMLGVGTGLAIAYPQEAAKAISVIILTAHTWVMQGIDLLQHTSSTV
jgi:hypothetical protein